MERVVTTAAQERRWGLSVPTKNFVTLWDQERSRLLGSMILFTGDRTLAEELTQDAFARAFAHQRKLKHIERPEAWLNRIAFNLAKSHFRKRSFERNTTERLQAQAVAPSGLDAATAIVIREAVLTLPSRERQAIILRFYSDLRVMDIAAVMGRPEGTVKTLIRRGLKTLESFLGPMTEEP